jgi:hypothetical protein
MTYKTFKTFLSEASEQEIKDISKFVHLVKSECSEFLKNNINSFKKENYLLRGALDYSAGSMYVQEPRSDRKPKDLSDNEHYVLDTYLYDKFGFKYRSGGVFCTQNSMQARAYGDLSIIFPVDGYKMLSSTLLRDAFDAINDLSSPVAIQYFNSLNKKKEFKNKMQELTKDSNLDFVYEYLDIYEFFETKKLEDIRRLSEISLQCKKYYSIFLSTPQIASFLEHFEFFE